MPSTDRSPRSRWRSRSSEGRLALLVASCALSSAGVALVARERIGLGFAASLALGMFMAVVAALLGARRAMRQHSAVLRAVTDGIESLKDRDFSISIAQDGDPAAPDELGALIHAYNGLGERLRDERQQIYQRELMLDTVVQATPVALVLVDAQGRVVYCNVAARELLAAGRRFEGETLAHRLAESPPELAEALARGGDCLFTMESQGEPNVFHLACRSFQMNAARHRLIMLKQMTRELAAQEVATWKRVIRVIAHELNNSLAPITSLAHSGSMLVGDQPSPALQRVFSTIEERARHLQSFVEGYSRFAKLPQPRLAPMTWPELLDPLLAITPFRIEGDLPQPAVLVDAVQFQQVLINLLKNAAESGSASDDITVAIRTRADHLLVEVADRGAGMSAAQLRQALLPFFSTKPSGSGLGLTICREIVEAHGGRLALSNRDGGGMVASIALPQDHPGAR